MHICRPGTEEPLGSRLDARHPPESELSHHEGLNSAADYAQRHPVYRVAINYLTSRADIAVSGEQGVPVEMVAAESAHVEDGGATM